MEKIIYKHAKSTKGFVFLIGLILVIFIPILLLPRPGEFDRTGFLQFLTLTILLLLFLVYCFFLRRWERFIVEDGFFKLRYSYAFLPCSKNLPIADIREVIFVYTGFMESNKFIEQETAKVFKKVILEKLNNLLVRRDFLEGLNYSEGKTSIRIAASQMIFKTDQTQAKISFFNKKAMLDIIKLLPKETKLSGQLKQIQYTGSSASY